jgi:hypothetical protein
MRWLGWASLKAVEKVHFFFESLETISLAAAIGLEFAGMRRASNIAWAVLVISDAGRWIYGRREKTLANQEAEEANLSRSRLEERLADRTISAEQRTKLIEILSSRKGETIHIDSLLSSGREGLEFAINIAAAFKESGWNLTEAPSGQHLFTGASTVMAGRARGAIVLSPVWSPTPGGGLDSSFTTLGGFIQASFVSARIRVSADPDMPMIWAPATSGRAVMILVLEK